MKLTKRHLALLQKIVDGHSPHYTQQVQTMRDLKSAGLIKIESDGLDNHWWSSTELAARALANPQLTYPDRAVRPSPNGARVSPAQPLPEGKRLVPQKKQAPVARKKNGDQKRQVTLPAEYWVFLEEYITNANPATAINMLVKNSC